MGNSHIAQSGKMAGQMVPCPAKNFCTLKTAEGMPVHHGNFLYDRDRNNWNKIEQVIAKGGVTPLDDSKNAMHVLENEQSLSDGTVQAILENESANQMGGTVHVLPRKTLEELAAKRKAAAASGTEQGVDLGGITDIGAVRSCTSPETLAAIGRNLDAVASATGATSVDIMRSLEANGNTPADTLDMVAHRTMDGTGVFKSWPYVDLARNPNLGQDTRSFMLKTIRESSRDGGLSWQARQYGETLEDMPWPYVSGVVVSGGITGEPVRQSPLVPLLSRTDDAGVLEEMSRSDETTVRCVVASNPHTPAETLERMVSDGYEYDVVRALAASNPSLPASGPAREYEDYEEYRRLGGEARADREMLGLSPDSVMSGDDWRSAAGKASADALANLASSSIPIVREAAASSVNASPETLAALAGDHDPDVMLAVARNGNASAAALDRLAHGGNGYVKTAVAGNPGTSPDTLAYLADNAGNDYTRSAVAANPNTPAGTLDAMAGRYADLRRIGDGDRRVVSELIDNPNTSVEALGRLYYTNDGDIMRKLAGSPRLDPSVLRHIAGWWSSDTKVLEQVAGNPNTDGDTLRSIANRPKDSECRRIARGRLGIA